MMLWDFFAMFGIACSIFSGMFIVFAVVNDWTARRERRRRQRAAWQRSSHPKDYWDVEL